ncbi:MAG: hypothetical protein AB3N64_03755 [Puniceicoccaceae bacterium]
MRLILAIVCVLMGLGYYLLTGWYPDVPWLQGTLFHLVWPVAITATGICLNLIARWLFARDPVLISWAIVGLAGCLLIFPLILARENQADRDSARQEAIQDSREQLRLQRLRLAKAEEERRAAERAEREQRGQTDRFVQYEGRIPYDTLDALRQLDQQMREALDAQSEAYAAAMEANPTKGPESWIRFRTIDQLEVELAAHRVLYEQTRAFTQFIESFEDTYTRSIESLDLQPPADRIAIAEMERVLQFWERSRVYDLRQLEVRLLGSAIAALNVLREAWGTWSYNPREQRVLFQNPEQEASFYEQIQLVQAIAIEVNAIREALDQDLEANP